MRMLALVGLWLAMMASTAHAQAKSAGPLSTNEVWIGPDISPVVGLSWGDVKAHYRPDGYGSN